MGQEKPYKQEDILDWVGVSGTSRVGTSYHYLRGAQSCIVMSQKSNRDFPVDMAEPSKRNPHRGNVGLINHKLLVLYINCVDLFPVTESCISSVAIEDY